MVSVDPVAGSMGLHSHVAVNMELELESGRSEGHSREHLLQPPAWSRLCRALSRQGLRVFKYVRSTTSLDNLLGIFFFFFPFNRSEFLSFQLVTVPSVLPEDSGSIFSYAPARKIPT